MESSRMERKAAAIYRRAGSFSISLPFNPRWEQVFHRYNQKAETNERHEQRIGRPTTGPRAPTPRRSAGIVFAPRTTSNPSTMGDRCGARRQHPRGGGDANVRSIDGSMADNGAPCSSPQALKRSEIVIQPKGSRPRKAERIPRPSQRPRTSDQNAPVTDRETKAIASDFQKAEKWGFRFFFSNFHFL
jgi:hypothetical protein